MKEQRFLGHQPNGEINGNHEGVIFQRAAYGKFIPDKEAVEEALGEMRHLYRALGVGKRSREQNISSLEIEFYHGDPVAQVETAQRIFSVRDCIFNAVQAMERDGSDLREKVDISVNGNGNHRRGNHHGRGRERLSLEELLPIY